MDDGFIVITLVGENIVEDAPDRGDLEDWADEFGLSHPVVADPGFGVTTQLVGGGGITLPTMHLLGPGAELIFIDQYLTEDHVRTNLP